MYISLIICTYKRALSLQRLLESVNKQTRLPNQIIIVDSSSDCETEKLKLEIKYNNLFYFKVGEKDRGLTKQRNFGIKKISDDCDVVSFLDDDTVLERDYFEKIVAVFKNNTLISGIGGVAINENLWVEKKEGKYDKNSYYQFGNYVLKEALRNKVRNALGLQSNFPSGILPEFGHGRTCGYPLTNDIHQVDLLIGMSMSFKVEVVKKIKFSTYFEGYGLYEDADFSIRAKEYGENVIATGVRLSHFHDPSGRPNQFKYGKMVVRNGWYVWRIKFPYPKFKARIKWHLITILLTLIRATNIVTTKKRKEALTETAGRIVGWISLFLSKPKMDKLN